jgi:SAM-dependent methyltransferase
MSQEWRRAVFDYNQWEREKWVARQAERIPAGSRVLDVGAGRGPYRCLFTHCEYRAHDFGKEPGTIGQYTALDYESDILDLPVADASFEVLLCTEVLEHVPEPAAAVREMARVLCPGGRLLLTSPLGSMLHQEPYHFYGGFTPHWYTWALPAAGLAVESIVPNRGFFSLFGQESRRFSVLIDPRRTAGCGGAYIGLTVLWAVTLPLLRWGFPLLGGALDRLKLEQVATAGYHVAAVKA